MAAPWKGSGSIRSTSHRWWSNRTRRREDGQAQGKAEDLASEPRWPVLSWVKDGRPSTMRGLCSVGYRVPSPLGGGMDAFNQPP